MPEKENQPPANSPSNSNPESTKPKRRGPPRSKKPAAGKSKKVEDSSVKQKKPDTVTTDRSVPQKQDNAQPQKRTQKQPQRAPERKKPHHDQAGSVRDLAKLKGVRPIVALTAYDSVMSRLVCDAGVDFILVGDSVGTTLLGHKTTIPVDMTDMLRHTAAVRRAEPNCLLVADLPFGEASFSFDHLLDSARRLMQQGGADAIKIEGGRDVADDIEKLVATGIPVLGHIGLLPQTVKAIGGYRKFGADRQEAEDLYTDAIALEEAGCFAVVGEMIEESVARELAKQILPPLIGIGSGAGCDGQILVSTDVLGYHVNKPPSFVKTYANLNQVISKALSQYVTEVKSKKFPA